MAMIGNDRFPPIAVVSSVGQARLMFDYDNIVRVKDGSPADMRPGAKAWVVGITTPAERSGSHFAQFPAGIVYLIEFEDGDALDIHESMLELLDG